MELDFSSDRRISDDLCTARHRPIAGTLYSKPYHPDLDYFIHLEIPRDEQEKINEEFLLTILSDLDADPSLLDDRFRAAINKNDIKMVDFLLHNRQIDPTINNNYAIIKAVESNHVDIVKLLLNDPRVATKDLISEAIKIAKDQKYSDLLDILVTTQLSLFMKLNN